ncbi:MAG: hypothetical protein JWN57_1462, partial [Frankiales bacterium]|nr:hypothetical protein [Frankiales bacterium]
LGYDRIGVRRGDTWLLRDSLAGGTARSYAEGGSGWRPVAGDTDGNGEDSLSLFRDGVWVLRESPQGPARTVRFGLRGDQPVLGDWDGDGVDTLGVFRGGRWYLRASNASSPAPARVFGFGQPGDVAVVGDWSADGRTDIAVRRGARWYQRDSATGGPSSRTFVFGVAGDRPVAGDWDHDGRDTPGVFRNGTWFFKQGNGFGTHQTTVLGTTGDLPVVRRTPGLAPGVTHRVVRTGESVAHVATVDLLAASTPDAVLAGDDLPAFEPTTSMARRTGAPLAINADYGLSSGRPVHAMAADGRLLQTPQLLGRAFSLDLTGTQVRMGFPDTRVVLRPDPATSTVLTRWNSGAPSGDELAGFTGVGAGLDTPPDDACYAGGTTGPRRVDPDGGVETDLQVTGTRCYGRAPFIGPSTTVLAGQPLTGAEALIRSLRAGQSVPMTQHLGFPGAVDVLGGNPLLIQDGVRQSQDLSGSGAFFARNPRTAVGVTGDGRMLLVVVDGRQGSYSAGMTLGELADFMATLGARDAINLDGGGSSTMVVNGLQGNRPSDGRERAVPSALVVLPGEDRGQADLQPLPADSAAARQAKAVAGASSAPPVQPTTVVPGAPVAGWTAAATDPGSVGGLADALARDGVPLPADLARADALYDAAR